MIKIIRIFAILFSIVFFPYSQLVAQNDEIVAKIGSKIITSADINRLISYFDLEKQKALQTNPQLKQTLLQQLVQSIVISDIAKKNGFDQKPDIREQMVFYYSGFISNEYLKREILNNLTVPETEVKSYYESHQEEFNLPEMIRARHILIKVDRSSSEKNTDRYKEQAENILKKIKEGEDFSKLASEMSDDQASKMKGGDLGFFSRGRMVKSFEDAAFSLQEGEVSGIIETQFGYHIIKVEEKKQPTIEPFESARVKIEQRLLQDYTRAKITEFIDKAMKDAQVEMYPEKLISNKN